MLFYKFVFFEYHSTEYVGYDEHSEFGTYSSYPMFGSFPVGLNNQRRVYHGRTPFPRRVRPFYRPHVQYYPRFYSGTNQTSNDTKYAKYEMIMFYSFYLVENLIEFRCKSLQNYV